MGELGKRGARFWTVVKLHCAFPYLLVLKGVIFLKGVNQAGSVYPLSTGIQYPLSTGIQKGIFKNILPKI